MIFCMHFQFQFKNCLSYKTPPYYNNISGRKHFQNLRIYGYEKRMCQSPDYYYRCQCRYLHHDIQTACYDEKRSKIIKNHLQRWKGISPRVNNKLAYNTHIALSSSNQDNMSVADHLLSSILYGLSVRTVPRSCEFQQ